MSLTLQEKMDRFRPIVCRLLARRVVSGKITIALTDDEIAERSGLPLGEVKGMSWYHDWTGVPVNHMMAFMKGCGINIDDSRALKYSWHLWNGVGKGAHLRRSPLWKTLFVPLIREAEKIK